MQQRGIISQPPPSPPLTNLGVLTEISNTLKDLRTLSGLDFAFEPSRYIVRKLRSGEALADKASYYQLIAAGATFTATFSNPEGYVWLGIREAIKTSQNGVIEFTRFLDDDILPWIYIPRLTGIDFNWLLTLPFALVNRETCTVIYTNHDAAEQWVAADWIGIYLRKDVWEKDSKYMDSVAEKYSHPEVV